MDLKFNDDPETFLNSKNKNNAIFLAIVLLLTKFVQPKNKILLI